MQLTNEVTYVINYNGAEFRLRHFVDDTLNLRHQGENGHTTSDVTIGSVDTLNIQGTKKSFQEIPLELFSERVIYEKGQYKEAELFYLLPDINYYVKVKYGRHADFSEGPYFDTFRVPPHHYFKANENGTINESVAE